MAAGPPLKRKATLLIEKQVKPGTISMIPVTLSGVPPPLRDAAKGLAPRTSCANSSPFPY